MSELLSCLDEKAQKSVLVTQFQRSFPCVLPLVLAQAPKAQVSPKNPQDHRSLKERVNFTALHLACSNWGIDPIAAIYWRRHH